ncbi:MAG TPA: 50S ribosomal protein L17 [Dehalococcoidales bacterium]|nr:50S ribosomal protein L17 [Dehalococcoidales bacterium]
MRHGMVSRRFDRPSGARQLMFRNLVTEILDHEKIRTTEPKAKAVRGMAEKMITLAKAGDLGSRRRALAFITDKKVTEKLFKELGPRYAERHGGYTRIIKIGTRLGDGATIVQIELVK